MPPRKSDGADSSAHVLTLLTLVGSPIALVTALMFYFGWVRSQAQAVAFKTDISVFEMSPQDLILRSVSILFFPILGLLLAGLLALRLHPWLRDRARYVSPVLRFSGVLVLVGVLVLILAEPIGRILLPLWAFLAIGGTAYGAWLRPRSKANPQPSSVAGVVLVVSLLVITLFWLTERLAQVAGDALADDLQQNLTLRLPAVTGSQFGVMLVPDQPRALREMVRVTKPGGRLLVIAYGSPAELEFLQIFVSALRVVAPEFPGLPDDPPPLEFQLAEPEVLRQRLSDAGLKNIRVERTAERPTFRSGRRCGTGFSTATRSPACWSPISATTSGRDSGRSSTACCASGPGQTDEPS